MKKVPDFSNSKGTPAKKAKKGAPSKPDTKVPATVKAGRVVLAAAMMGLPMVLVPQQAAAQSTVGPPPISPTKPAVPSISLNFAKVEAEYRPIKLPGTFTVLGVGDGHTIFKSADGSMFYLDPTTGDKRSVAVDYFLKISDIKSESRSTAAKHVGGGGGAGKVNVQDISITSIIGLDAKGNAVMRNAQNETFTMDPKTGNKVFIKLSK